MEAMQMNNGYSMRKFSPGEIARLLDDQRGTWTPELVLTRFVEAVQVADICVREPRPSSKMAMTFPFYRAEDYQEEIDVKRKRTRVTPLEVARMEEAMQWMSRYVKDEQHRAIISGLVRTRAFGGNFRRVCRVKHWGKTQAYEIINANLRAIAGALNRAKVPL
jgi:hypothetical protein